MESSSQSVQDQINQEQEHLKEDQNKQKESENETNNEEEKKGEEGQNSQLSQEEHKQRLISQLQSYIDRANSGQIVPDRQTYEQIQQLIPLYQKHDFWDSQPVPKTSISEQSVKGKEGPLIVQKVEEIQKEPYKLPEGFEWVSLDLEDLGGKDLNDLYIFLRDNYVEDKEHQFRFDYPKEFLQWALLIPGFKKEWFVGVRVAASGKLVGFISGIPIDLKLNDRQVKAAEINYLCVYKKLRTKRLAPVLIKEVTRRVNQEGVWQAVYTAGVVIPKPIATAVYWHRSLNVRKLVECGFNELPPKTSMAQFVKTFKLPKNSSIVGNVRQMEERDCEQVYALLKKYLKRFKLKMNFTLELVKHSLLPKPNVLFSYVVEDTTSKPTKITDFISFYSLPSAILSPDSKHKCVNVAYAYYFVPSKFNTIRTLFEEALILAQNQNLDVFNALDIMNNRESFDDLKFGLGDGYLHYYLYNWQLGKDSRIHQSELGMVLV